MSFTHFNVNPHPENTESEYNLYEFNITDEQLDDFLIKAIENQQHIGRNNLRGRNPLIQIDNFIRGYIGEYAMSEIIKKDPSIAIKQTNFKPEASSIDFDFSLSINDRDYILEVKTSGINKNQDTVTKMVGGDPSNRNQSGRIIIFDRHQGDLTKIEDLQAQFIFNSIIPDRDNYLNIEYQRYLEEIFPKQYQQYLSSHPNAIPLNIEEQKKTAEEVLADTIGQLLSPEKQAQKNQKIFNIIKNHLKLDYKPLQQVFFVGWTTKDYVVHNINYKINTQQPTQWQWGDRTFWDVRISESFVPEDFNGKNILQAIPAKILTQSQGNSNKQHLKI